MTSLNEELLLLTIVVWQPQILFPVNILICMDVDEYSLTGTFAQY